MSRSMVPRWRLPLSVRIVWTIGLSSLAAATGLVLTLNRILKPSTWAWVHDPRLLIGLVVALAALTFLDTAKRTAHRLMAPRLEKQAIELRKQLGSLIVAVSEVTGYTISEIGCGLFLIQPRGIRRPTQLYRVQRVRLVDVVRESNVQFTIGKGTVGACWQHERTEFHNWHWINSKYDGEQISDARWANMRDNVKRGFTKKEFMTLVGKYSEVLAEPIMVDGGFVGCLALDLRWNKEDESYAGHAVLDDKRVRTQLSAAAKTIVPALKR